MQGATQGATSAERGSRSRNRNRNRNRNRISPRTAIQDSEKGVLKATYIWQLLMRMLHSMCVCVWGMADVWSRASLQPPH